LPNATLSPRPRALIHAALASLDREPDADALKGLAASFDALVAATDLAKERWANLFAEGGGARLLHEAARSLAPSVAALAKACGIEPVGVAAGFEDLLGDCDCVIALGNAASTGIDDPVLNMALAANRPIIVTRPGVQAPVLVSPLADETSLTGVERPGAGHEPLTARALADHILAPPQERRERDHLARYLREGPARQSSRFEYDLLMRALGPRDRPAGVTNQAAPGEDWTSAAAIAKPHGGWVKLLEGLHAIADGQASFYGEKYRSAAVTRSFLLLASTIVLAFVGMLREDLGLYTIAGQTIIAAFIFVDRRQAARGDWQRKWLEYRLLAQRLRCLRYLRLAGVAEAPGSSAQGGGWTDWYARRVARMLGPCAAPDSGSAAAVLAHLLDTEIGEQIAYHREAVRRFAALDARTRLAGRWLLGAAVLAGLMMFTASFAFPAKVSWPGIAGLALSAIPAIAAGLTAFRAEFDLVRLMERSLRIRRGLLRLSRLAKEEARNLAPCSTDVLALDKALARRAAALMLDEVSQWRFVLEARAARVKR
jgi:hypothetical protein